MTALHILEHIFGYTSFRGEQEQIITCLANGQDALVVMPTGGGKSLCYQIPALLREGVAIVVSPLIALMQDQVSALHEVGVKASFLNSTLDYDEIVAIENALQADELDLLYIAPERLLQARTLALLKRAAIALIAIDEAHCVSQWGHDFRKDYLALSGLREHFPKVPLVALTATADARTREEIIQRLQLQQGRHFVCGFDRPNIQYRIKPKLKARDQLLDFLRFQQAGNSGIVYCLSRRKVEETAEWLQKQGYTALPYHAGIQAETRKQHQDRFLREDNIIIVATIAFGMGIDKPDVRFVVHMDMPKSIEAYYQETGRAGRDGEPATALLFYGIEDVVKLKQMVDASNASEDFKRLEQQRLNALLGLCELVHCRRQTLLRYFGETLSDACGNCDNCLSPPDTWDASIEAQKALSCVYRTGQRFGVNHVIDVLRGANNEKIRQFQHNTISTYGIGKDVATKEWRAVFRQLIARGYLLVDSEQYGALKLTEESRPVLKGELTLTLRKDVFSALDASGRSRSPKVLDSIEEADQPLWKGLRALRKQLADEHGVPPYVIFHDATLTEIVIHRPQNTSELLRINGVGDQKLNKFGDDFLELIKEHEFEVQDCLAGEEPDNRP